MKDKAHVVEHLIKGAEFHGQSSEPDHEVGDLQGLLRECWSHMTNEQRQTVMLSEIGRSVDNEYRISMGWTVAD